MNKVVTTMPAGIAIVRLVCFIVLLGICAKVSRQQQIRNLVLIIMHSAKSDEANGIMHFTGIARCE